MFHEHHDGGILVTTDPSRLDLDAVHGFLVGSYWAQGIPREPPGQAFGEPRGRPATALPMARETQGNPASLLPDNLFCAVHCLLHPRACQQGGSDRLRP